MLTRLEELVGRAKAGGASSIEVHVNADYRFVELWGDRHQWLGSGTGVSIEDAIADAVGATIAGENESVPAPRERPGTGHRDEAMT